MSQSGWVTAVTQDGVISILFMKLRRQREYKNKNTEKDKQLYDMLTLVVAHVCAPGKDQFFHSVLLCFHLISNFVIFLPVILPHFSPLLFSFMLSFSLYCSCWQIWQEDGPLSKPLSTLAQPVLLCPRLCCWGFSPCFGSTGCCLSGHLSETELWSSWTAAWLSFLCLETSQ